MPDIRDVAYKNLLQNAQVRRSSYVTQKALQSSEIADLEAAEHCGCNSTPACSACLSAATLHHSEQALQQALNDHNLKLEKAQTDRRQDAQRFQSIFSPAEQNNKHQEYYLSESTAGGQEEQKQTR